jgi:dsDNA-specific endonuclease/ATPase MutS2
LDIYQRSLKSLEWERLVLALAGLAETSSGRQRLVILLPEAAPGELLLANLLLDQTKEALDLINARAYPSLAGLEISTDTLSVLSLGGALSIHELLAVFKLLRISRTVKNSLALLDKTSFPCLHPFAARFCSTTASGARS